MSFSELYRRVQAQDGRISTRWLREQVIELSPITRVVEQWSGVIDASVIRGFYIEGPMGPPIPLNANEALIGLPRKMMKAPDGKAWRRFALTKELMHCFDREDEKADTEAKFDIQIERFFNPGAEMSPQFRAEQKAFWRALAVLCQEDRRQKFKAQLEAGEISVEVVAAALGVPTLVVRELVREVWDAVVDYIQGG